MRMSLSEALAVILELAQDNQLDEDSTDGDDRLEDVRRWQEAALESLEKFISEHGREFDREIATPKAGFDVDIAELQPAPGADPTIPTNFLKIALSLGRTATIDPEDVEGGDELMGESLHQQRAIEIIETMIVLHGEQLNNKYRHQCAPVPSF